MSELTEEQKAILKTMTAANIGESFIAFIVQEIKALPDVWQKLNEVKQDDVIERARRATKEMVGRAVHLLSSENKPVIDGVIKQATVKGGIELKVDVTKCSSDDKLELIEHSGGGNCLIILADAAENMGNLHAVKPDKDQPDLPITDEEKLLPETVIDQADIYSNATYQEIVNALTLPDAYSTTSILTLIDVFELTQDEARRVILRLLDDKIIELQLEDDNPDNNVYNIIKK